MKSRSIQPACLLFTALFLVIFWNFWLPEAQTLINVVSAHTQTSNMDFLAYYRGGQAYLRGQGPYSGTSDGQPFIYPPTFVPFYALLANLSNKRARFLWVGLYALFFILNLILLLIRQGQIDLIVISLCFASFLFYRKKIFLDFGLLTGSGYTDQSQPVVIHDHLFHLLP